MEQRQILPPPHILVLHLHNILKSEIVSMKMTRKGIGLSNIKNTTVHSSTFYNEPKSLTMAFLKV